jgi:hypothetical protein
MDHIQEYLTIVVVQVGAVKIYIYIYIYIYSSSGGAQEQDETQFTTKIAGKTSLGPSSFVRFVKFSFPVTRLMAYYASLKLAVLAPP